MSNKRTLEAAGPQERALAEIAETVSFYTKKMREDPDVDKEDCMKWIDMLSQAWKDFAQQEVKITPVSYMYKLPVITTTNESRSLDINLVNLASIYGFFEDQDQKIERHMYSGTYQTAPPFSQEMKSLALKLYPDDWVNLGSDFLVKKTDTLVTWWVRKSKMRGLHLTNATGEIRYIYKGGLAVCVHVKSVDIFDEIVIRLRSN